MTTHSSTFATKLATGSPAARSACTATACSATEIPRPSHTQTGQK